MALVRSDLGVPISFSFLDNNAKRATVGLYLPEAIVTGGIDTFVTDVRGPLLALTDASLQGAAATYIYGEDAPTIPPATSEVERKLLLTFQSNIRGDYLRMEIPSPVFSLEQQGTDVVPVSNPLVAAFAQAIINGALGPGNGPVTIRNNSITQIVRAEIVHRTRRPSR